MLDSRVVMVRIMRSDRGANWHLSQLTSDVFKGFQSVFQGFSGIRRRFQRFFKGFQRLFNGVFKGFIVKGFQGGFEFKGFSNVFPGFQEFSNIFKGFKGFFECFSRVFDGF